MALPEPDKKHVALVESMRAKARTGWYTGDLPSLLRYGAKAVVQARTVPECVVSMQLSRDKMHHSVGWWRNAEYEYCWHLSICLIDRLQFASTQRKATILNRSVSPPLEELPRDELRYWARLIFGEHVDKLWNEPGGTDPRLSREEAQRNARFWHLRLFLEPELLDARGEPHVPFIPQGEVYDLTRWIDGLTPEKVDR